MTEQEDGSAPTNPDSHVYVHAIGLFCLKSESGGVNKLPHSTSVKQGPWRWFFILLFGLGTLACYGAAIRFHAQLGIALAYIIASTATAQLIIDIAIFSSKTTKMSLSVIYKLVAIALTLFAAISK